MKSMKIKIHPKKMIREGNTIYGNADDSKINSKGIDDSRFVYVTTLDGRLTALDITNGGFKFSVITGPGPLLSSSIHQLELTNSGKWIRMIPSINGGGLYQFDGDSIEPIPITATNLLDSSFKFSDDLVISGSSILTYFFTSLEPFHK